MLLDGIIRDLKIILSSITIKYENLAKQNETVETARAWDRYYVAYHKLDNFNTYPNFDFNAIKNAGVWDDALAQKYAEDKSLIPDSMRDLILEEQRKYIVSTFEERNNYYRMLIGLPNVEDTDFVYVDQDKATQLGLNPSKPVHQMTDAEILLLEKNGIIQELKNKYPDKKYLNYLGLNKINLFVAREAKPFSILSMTNKISEEFYQEFINTYELCREYFMTVIYNKDFGSRFDLYDNFIGMMIMVMTIQRMIVNTFKYGIERDFYDLSSIQTLFSVYNVPFLEKLPIEYQRAIARNLNNLLRYKSTDKVLYDICSLLGYERANIFRYYLIKEHNLDENEKPLFIYKEETDKNGNTILVEDKEKMYSLYFQKVELRERNVALALTNNNVNKINYNQVILDDVFWWDDDEELKRTLYESEFNYIETKFLGLSVMYKITEMLFEVMYIFNLLIDKKQQVKDIQIELPLITDKKIPIFNVVILLCALIAKKNNLVGEIISSPSKALSIMGFNFGADFATIRQEIMNNPKIYDQRLINYLLDMDIYNPSDINGLFKNIRELNDFLVEKLATVQNLEQYRAYKKLYDTLMVTTHADSLFKKSDGTIAKTFLDYLEDADIFLAEFVNNVDMDDIPEYIQHIIYRINNFITELRYLYILDDTNNVVLNAIVTLIRFFKSYTVDLAPLNILYLMDSRYFNMIKLVNEMKHMDKVLGIDSTDLNMRYSDTISYYTSTFTNKDNLCITDRIKLIWEE